MSQRVDTSTKARPARPAFARGPVWAAVAAQAVVLTATSSRYGYERDELYFRTLHPGWGYLDQPPLTPLLARLSRYLLADQVWALRVWATLAAAVSVLVVAAITREVGGARGAQGLSAWAYAFASFPLVFGHVLLTTSIDEAVWLAVLLFVIRARLRAQNSWWLWAGVVVGVGLYNKLLIVVLLAALAGGVLIAGPRRLLVSRAVLAAMAVALIVGLPNVLYQARNGWPQLEFGRQLSAHNAGAVRVSMWPTLGLLLGPPLVVLWISGVVALWRRPEWRDIRFLAAALPVLLLIVFALGSQPYYPLALVGMYFAVGCVPTWDWITRHPRPRRWVICALVSVNAVVSAVIALPLVPVRLLHDTPVPGINQVVQDSVGWPTYTGQVAAVYRSLPAVDRAGATVVASNYGEAGALARYGPAVGLPRIFSAHNQLYFQGRPPDSALTAIVVGGQATSAAVLFRSCTTVTHLDNGLQVDNEEQGEPVAVCRGPVGGWATVWPKLKHED
jgi:4-amino-4-deoxy-L-arabinose transferase-like glycosyltransferase